MSEADCDSSPASDARITAASPSLSSLDGSHDMYFESCYSLCAAKVCRLMTCVVVRYDLLRVATES